ncbi:MAG: hypothetical protein HY744_18830 [Deltaproteobacteria bacterium]|nr:hypothetical protein [Deltaproteobacteria bacterium]
MARPPEFAPEDQTQCKVKKSQSKPLVVEWPSADRGELEGKARSQVVVVSYSGCEMVLLPHCKAPGTYRYSALTPKQDTITIKNEDELYASIPIYAARFEGKLASAGELNVVMTIVGRYDTDRPEVRADELDGMCQGATHVIAGLAVGAFEFFAGAAAEVGAGAEVLGAGAGARSRAKREMLNRDGQPNECQAGSAAPSPPAGCGALLRVEVVRLGEPKEPEITCPPDTTLEGGKCVAGVECPAGTTLKAGKCVAGVECPAGTTLQGGKCVAVVDRSCKAGMHFEAGRGCVANVVPAQPVSVLPPPAPAPAGPGELGVPGPKPGPFLGEQPPAETSDGTTLKIVGLITGGVGLAGVGIGVGFTVYGDNKYEESLQYCTGKEPNIRCYETPVCPVGITYCPGMTLQRESQDAHKVALGSLIAGGVLTVTGAVLAAIGLVQSGGVSSASSASEAKPSESEKPGDGDDDIARLSVSPWLGPSEAGLALTGQF